MTKEPHPKFPEVRDWIARFETRSMLEQVAGLGVEMSMEAGVQVSSPRGQSVIIAHHFLARIALMAAVHGRSHGRTATRDDVIQACGLWGSMDEPLLHAGDHGTVDDAHEFLIRTSWDQFPLQEAPHLGIPIWFGIYRRAQAAGYLGVAFDELWMESFGLELDHWYRAALVFWLLVIGQGLPPELMGLPAGTRPVGIAATFSMGELRKRTEMFGPGAEGVEAVVTDLCQTREEIARRYEQTRPDDPDIERYAYNPLSAHPIVRLGAARFVLPVPRLFGNAMGLATLYRLMERNGQFAADFGKAFEHYVGESLRSTFGEVLPEETYRVGNDKWGGFDWTVIEPGYSLLIECRTSRVPLGPKTSGGLDDIVKGLKRTVSVPAEKMPTKIEHIKAGHTRTPPEILTRPVHRIIVTLERLHLESLYTELAGYDPAAREAPIVMSVGTLHQLLSVDGRSIHELIDEYQAEYVSGTSGSIDAWLLNHPVCSSQIGHHPAAQEDRELLLPPRLEPNDRGE